MELNIEEKNAEVVRTYGYKKKDKVVQHPRLLPVVPDLLDYEIPKSKFVKIERNSPDSESGKENPEGVPVEHETMLFVPLKSDKSAQISLSQSSADTSSSSSSPVTHPSKFIRKRKRTGRPLRRVQETGISEEHEKI